MISDLFAHLLEWVMGFIFTIPIFVLRLIGLLLPTCGDFSITSFGVTIIESATQWIRFCWPFLQYVPWDFMRNFASAVILYVFVKWVLRWAPKLTPSPVQFWWIIVIFWIVAWFGNFILDQRWADSDVFTQVFGTSATGTTGFSGGGGGGGGGGSW